MVSLGSRGRSDPQDKQKGNVVKGWSVESTVKWMGYAPLLKHAKCAQRLGWVLGNVLRIASLEINKGLLRGHVFEFFEKCLNEKEVELQLTILAALANFALSDALPHEVGTALVQSGLLEKMSSMLLAPATNDQVKMRIATTLANLTTMETAQREMKGTPVLKALLQTATAHSLSLDLRQKAGSALFHLSMYFGLYALTTPSHLFRRCSE